MLHAQESDAKLAKAISELAAANSTIESLKVKITHLETLKPETPPIQPHSALSTSRGHQRKISESDPIVTKITADFVSAQGTISSLNAKIAVLEKEIEVLQKQLSEADSRADAAEEKLQAATSVETERSELEEKITDLEGQLWKSNYSGATTQTQLQQVEKQLQDQLEKNQQLEQEVAALKKPKAVGFLCISIEDFSNEFVFVFRLQRHR
jgi:chromosome segregation ATPase